MLSKTLIIITLVLIIVSLFSALALLFRNADDPGKRQRVVQALTVRVSLSIGLFLIISGGIFFGFIPRGW